MHAYFDAQKIVHDFYCWGSSAKALSWVPSVVVGRFVFDLAVMFLSKLFRPNSLPFLSTILSF